MASPVIDIEQTLTLLELEAPFDKRDVQLARRRQAKRWHPDLAPPGQQVAHQRHLQAINEAADRLEALAEDSRGGQVTKNAVRASAAAARVAREEAGRRAYEEEQRQRAAAQDQAKHDPFGSRMPDHSVVHRYARCTSYPEWGVGSVTGVYFTGQGDDVQQWARVQFQVGIRTVPAGTLQFVDFSTPDPGQERVQRFVTAAQHAMAEGDYAIAAKRLLYARDTAPRDVDVLRMLTLAEFQAGDLPAAARCVRDWLRVDGHRAAPHRFAARIYEAQGATTQAAEACVRFLERDPDDAAGWERLGRLLLRLHDRHGALEALDRAAALGGSVEGLLDLALAAQLAGDLGRELDAVRRATEREPAHQRAWARYAHALARTDRRSDALHACQRALELDPKDREVRALRDELRAQQPRELAAARAAA